MSYTGRYGALDRLLFDVAFRAGNAQRFLAEIEELLYKAPLKDVPLQRPVFVTALPRSGTTILLKLLYDSGHFASHIYRDMPFVLCPMIWSRFSSRFGGDDEPKERAHGDGLTVSADSPEAFEEMIWKRFWPEHYMSDRISPWSADEKREEFELFLESNMRKVVALRQHQSPGRSRYVSKNNANIARLGSSLRPLRDGVFLVPFREPIQHAASMLAQHRRFSGFHEEDPFMRRYMAAIGHHEFGHGLRPIDFDGWLRDAPSAERLEFWVRYWIAAYRAVLERIPPSARLICYSDLTADPKSCLARIAHVVEVDEPDLVRLAERVQPPRHHDVSEGDVRGGLRDEARDVHRLLKQRAL